LEKPILPPPYCHLPLLRKVRRSSFKVCSDPDLVEDSLDGGDAGVGVGERVNTSNPPSPKIKKIRFQKISQIPDDKLAMILKGLHPSFVNYHPNFKNEKITVNQLLSGFLTKQDYTDLGIQPNDIEVFLSHFKNNGLDGSFSIPSPLDNSTPRVDTNFTSTCSESENTTGIGTGQTGKTINETKNDADNIQASLIPKVFTNTADQIHIIDKKIEKNTAEISKNPKILSPAQLRQNSKGNKSKNSKPIKSILVNDKTPIKAAMHEVKNLEKEISEIIKTVDRIDDKVCLDVEKAKERAKLGDEEVEKLLNDNETKENKQTAAPPKIESLEPIKLGEKVIQEDELESKKSNNTGRYIAIFG